MKQRSERVYVYDMLTAVTQALQYVSSREAADFSSDTMLFDAVCRQLEILGEAATHVGPATRALAPGIPWKRVVGLRNVLIHRYHRLDPALVWKTVHEELPQLAGALRELLEQPLEGELS